MDSLDELGKTSHGKAGFIKHVFNFNEESKADILNIIQYAVLALIPVVILNKAMQKYVPEADDEKASVMILLEILAQIIVMFLGILLIHRITTFVPTYSGEKYAGFNVTNIILAMLVIILSLQTKLGEKVSILVDRLVELWEGPKQETNGKNKGKKGNVKVSQPISQNQMATNQALNSYGSGSTSISSLPTNNNQPMPDYNNMQQQEHTQSVGPSMENMEPMAANAGGSGAFGSAFGGGW
jgi:hypothetical protein